MKGPESHATYRTHPKGNRESLKDDELCVSGFHLAPNASNEGTRQLA